MRNDTLTYLYAQSFTISDTSDSRFEDIVDEIMHFQPTLVHIILLLVVLVHNQSKCVISVLIPDLFMYEMLQQASCR